MACKINAAMQYKFFTTKVTCSPSRESFVSVTRPMLKTCVGAKSLVSLAGRWGFEDHAYLQRQKWRDAFR